TQQAQRGTGRGQRREHDAQEARADPRPPVLEVEPRGPVERVERSQARGGAIDVAVTEGGGVGVDDRAHRHLVPRPVHPSTEVEVGEHGRRVEQAVERGIDRKSTRLNSSHVAISYAVFCLKKKKRPFGTANLSTSTGSQEKRL